MRCDKCGVEAIVLKTVRLRDGGEQMFEVCDECWLPARDRLWIVPGSVACFGRCSSCARWFSVRELRDPKPGRKDAWAGTCRMCAEEG